MTKAAGPYRLYVLGLFTLIYAFNFIDRQIVTILAPFLKADLGLTDAQVGLLFGTAFALFYALFGLPLAKLADGWHRVGTLSLGLAIWSAMTTLSGLATGFVQLALARVGVGIGEASASPAAFSVLQDYFPKERRATALAVYSSGIYIGAGASLVIGGQIVAWWQTTYGATPPFGLRGWQAAYMLIGAPGILLALLAVLTVREPVRGAIDGHPHAGDPHPFRAVAASLGTLFPPFSLVALRRLGAPPAALWVNIAVLAACIAGARIAVLLTDGMLAPAKRAVLGQIGGIGITTNMVQWSAIAGGVYATASWIGALRRSDRPATTLITASPSFIALSVGGGLLSGCSYGLSAFIFLHATRYLGVGPEAGFAIGGIAAVCGGLGTMTGGVLADAVRRRFAAGRLYVASGAVTIATLCLVVQYLTQDWTLFLVMHAIATFCLTMWLGPVFATCQDHVLPRMRGVATAVQFLGTNLIGLGLGPYLVGLVSDVTGELRVAMLSALGIVPVVLALFLFAASRLAQAEATLIARARAAGEPV